MVGAKASSLQRGLAPPHPIEKEQHCFSYEQVYSTSLLAKLCNYADSSVVLYRPNPDQI